MGELMAWDPISGKKVWTIPDEYPTWSGTVATAGDLVFFGTLDGWFKAADARTGKVLWQFKTGSGIIGSLSPIAGLIASSMSQFFPASAVGRVPSSPPISIHETTQPQTVGAALCATEKRDATRRNALCFCASLMCSPPLFLPALFCLPLMAAPHCAYAPTRTTCPFRTARPPGFDNRIVTLVAHDLHREITFVWARPRRGFLREQFNKNACDVLLGVPIGLEELRLPTLITFELCFVTPARRRLRIASFDR